MKHLELSGDELVLHPPPTFDADQVGQGRAS